MDPIRYNDFYIFPNTWLAILQILLFRMYCLFYSIFIQNRPNGNEISNILKCQHISRFVGTVDYHVNVIMPFVCVGHSVVFRNLRSPAKTQALIGHSVVFRHPGHPGKTHTLIRAKHVELSG